MLLSLQLALLTTGRAFPILLGAALRFGPLKRCARSAVVRPYLPPVGRARHGKHPPPCSAHRLLSWGRSSHGPQATGLRSFALPRPDALSPPPLSPLWRAHKTRRYEHPLADVSGLSGWGYVASPNGRSRPSSMNWLPRKYPRSTTYSSPRSRSRRAEYGVCLPVLAEMLTTLTLRPSKSTFPPSLAACSASS